MIIDPEQLGYHLPIGSRHYRAFVRPPARYDLVGAMQFCLLASLGLRETHFLLGVGCGSLRGGRLFIPYLLPGHYFGVEPEKWLLEEGIRNECGQDLIRIKQPVLSSDSNFNFTCFNRKFDFLLAQSIFSHASQRQIRRCLSEASKCMHSTSIFAATFLQGSDDYSGDEWVYPGCVSYRFEKIRGLAQEAGLGAKMINWPHPNGQVWLLIANPSNLACMSFWVWHFPWEDKGFNMANGAAPPLSSQCQNYRV